MHDDDIIDDDDEDAREAREDLPGYIKKLKETLDKWLDGEPDAVRVHVRGFMTQERGDRIFEELDEIGFDVVAVFPDETGDGEYGSLFTGIADRQDLEVCDLETIQKRILRHEPEDSKAWCEVERFRIMQKFDTLGGGD